MKVLVTGGMGFIGRWVVKRLLDEHHEVWVIDNLSNGKNENIEEFEGNPLLRGVVVGDIRDFNALEKVFENNVDVCIHAAAQINVQNSLDDAKKDFEINAFGTLNVLENCKRNNTKMVFVSSCMVYDMVDVNKAISEQHMLKPASPYAASKIAAESLTQSYYYGYKLPVVILRPFNTYGPFQKSNHEGGVISVFLKKELAGEKLDVFGDGMQTRDFLYVEDCAEFIVKAAFNEKVVGEIINAGLGKDITINELARLICKDNERIMNVKHHHPQSEIPKLLCDYSKAEKLLDWRPRTNLDDGLLKTREWMKKVVE